MRDVGGHHKRSAELVGNVHPVFIPNLPFSNMPNGVSIANTGRPSVIAAEDVGLVPSTYG